MLASALQANRHYYPFFRVCGAFAKDRAEVHNFTMEIRGFILQASYRVTSGVPVVHLFGRLEDGRSFLVRDKRSKPHFYVVRDAGAAATAAGATAVLPVHKKTFAGEPVARVEVATNCTSAAYRPMRRTCGSPFAT